MAGDARELEDGVGDLAAPDLAAGRQSQALDTSRPASLGDTVTVVVTAADPSLVGSQGRIHITVGGVDVTPLQIIAGVVPGTVQVTFQMPKSFGGAGVPLTVTIDSSHSDPFIIATR